jgi:kynurenine formamidase
MSSSIQKLALAIYLSAGYLAGCQHSPEHSARLLPFDHLQDLTYTLTPEFPYIPVHNLTFPFSMTPIATIPKNGVAANTWHIHEHLGTHIDAPNHFDPNGSSVDDISLEDLIVPVEVIDIQKKSAEDPDAELTPDDIHQFEDRYGRIPAHSCVMMLSGWERWVSTPKYLGLDSMGVKHFPGFSTAAIDYLVRQRRVAGIGADVISFDPGRDGSYKGHRLLFSMGKWAVENIANLSKIPATGATLFVGAPKIGHATGGIARIFAVW